MQRFAGLPLFLLALFSTLLLVGCENSIDPYSQRGLYAVYGYLELERPKHFVRVRPLRTPLSSETTSVNATVTLKNLEDGTTSTLEDSIITFTDNNSRVATHNFWTEHRVQARTKYQLTIESPTGETVQATTVTPTGEDASVDSLRGHCRNSFHVTFKGVEAPRLVRASIIFYAPNSRYDDERVTRFEVDQTESIVRNEDGVPVLNFIPSEIMTSKPVARPEVETAECKLAPVCLGLASNHMFLEYTYLGPEWYGEIPEDTLRFDPLTSQDVINGLGFFGSVRRDRIEIIVDNCHILPKPPVSRFDDCPEVDLDTVETAPCPTYRGLDQNSCPPA